MSITLDVKHLRGGTRVTQICHILRRLISQAWILDDNNKLRFTKVYVMCELSSINNEQVLTSLAKIQVSVVRY